VCFIHVLISPKKKKNASILKSNRRETFSVGVNSASQSGTAAWNRYFLGTNVGGVGEGC